MRPGETKSIHHKAEGEGGEQSVERRTSGEGGRADDPRNTKHFLDKSEERQEKRGCSERWRASTEYQRENKWLFQLNFTLIQNFAS